MGFAIFTTRTDCDAVLKGGETDRRCVVSGSRTGEGQPVCLQLRSEFEDSQSGHTGSSLRYCTEVHSLCIGGDTNVL